MLFSEDPPAHEESGQLNYKAVLELAADVAKGMLHLHALNVVHGDLKVSSGGRLGLRLHHALQ